MPANTNPIIQSPNFPYPIQKNDQGGFDILLRKRPLSQPAITDQPAAASNLPPGMSDEEAGLDAGAGDFIGNMPRPRPENGPPMPQAPAAQDGNGSAIGGMIDNVFGGGGQSTIGTHGAAPPDMGGGPLSKLLPGGWGDTIASAVGGMQNIDRNQSPLAALASGMGGAMTTRENRRKSKREEMLSDEDRAIAADERLYRHGRDTKEDLRADKRDVWAEHADERAADAAEREGRTFLMTEALTGQKAKVTELEMQKAKIELDRAAAQHGLTPKESADLYGHAVSEANTLFKEKDMEAEGVAASYRKTIDDNFHAMLAAAGGGDGAPAAPQGASGTGARETPISWSPGAAPRDGAAFKQQMDAAVAANGGQPVWYTNPSDGKILPYTGAAAGAPR